MTEPQLAVSVSGRGRMYRHPENNALYPSVTNIIDVLAKPWLAGWTAKMVAGEAWDQRKAIVELADREQAVDMLKGAPYRKRNKAAAIGDLIHKKAEAVAIGMPGPEIPEEAEPIAEAFDLFLAEYQPVFVVREGIIFHGHAEDPLRYAGTFDFLAEIGAFVVIGDYKTSPNVYDEVALQLSALLHGHELWDEATGDLRPMPAVDGAIAVNLRPRELKVHLVDAGDAAFHAFTGLRMTWDWDKEHTGAVGPAMNLARLERELRKPGTMLGQLEMSVKASSGPVAAGETVSVAGPGLDPGPDGSKEK